MGGKEYMGRVASLGCILCQELDWGESPAEVHHVFDTASRSPSLTVPLCPEHHRGATGFHGMGQRAFERAYKLTDANLLALTLARINAAS